MGVHYFTQGLRLVLLSSVLIAPVELSARPQAPDNTAANKSDTTATAQTADSTKNNMSDVQLASHIRRDVVGDKSLSTYGHNVKIIARHGKVTLKGPVHSDDEKKTIEAYATKYAGDGNVTDNITVKGDGK